VAERPIMSMRRNAARALWRNRRGVVAAEYVFLVTFVAIPIITGIGMGGLKLLGSYQTQKQLVLHPYP